MIEQLRQNPALQIGVSLFVGAVLFALIGAIAQPLLQTAVGTVNPWVRDILAGGVGGAALGTILTRINAPHSNE
jgi:putative Mn2+ efflux pump MntP